MKILTTISILISTCFFVTVSAQEASIQQVQQKFSAFSNTHPQEKLFVHTDKNFYMVGEIMWFKVYDDRQDQLSKVAYIDVIDQQNRSVLSAKISLKENENNGSLLLPLALNSGNYILRAYTNWMKNTAAMSFFETKITVVNPFKNPDTASQHYLQGYEINFFPEGGSMVKGLESKIAFKIADKYGKGIDAKGYVLNDQNQQVATFQTYKFGMGNFVFTPTDKKYKAVINFSDGTTTTQSLPDVNDNGYVMSVSTSGDNLKVQVKTSYTGPQRISLFIRNNQTLKVSESRIINEGVALFIIRKQQLGKGVLQLTAFNANNLPVCERLYFSRPDKNVTLDALPNSKEYKTRNKVQINILVKNKQSLGLPADMSLAVVPTDSIQQFTGTDIESYFWLASDVRGYVQSPSFYFQDNAIADQAADNLMLTQGWRKYNWNDILEKDSSNPIKYLPEYSGHFVNIRITDTRTNKPAVNKEVFFSAPGKPFEFLTALTDENGLVQFNTKELYGLKKIIVQVNTAESDAYKIELLNPFYQYFNEPHFPFYLPIYQNILEQYSINMQVQNIYNADSMRMFFAHNSIDTLPFYGKGFASYNLDDYTRFTTMEEVLREYVREINVVARNGNHYMKILDEPRQEYNEEGVLVLWDGVPLQNPHSIFKFDPLKVKRLEVIPRRYAAGDLLFKGIASFTTYNSDLSGYSISPDMLAVDYDGLQLQREFYSPTYETTAQINSRMPDFRNTLFWSPNVNTTIKGDAKVNFYTSDRKGSYIGILQGLDKEGNPLISTFTFMVK